MALTTERLEENATKFGIIEKTAIEIAVVSGLLAAILIGWGARSWAVGIGVVLLIISFVFFMCIQRDVILRGLGVLEKES